jgi:hypothetical protein
MIEVDRRTADSDRAAAIGCGDVARHGDCSAAFAPQQVSAEWASEQVGELADHATRMLSAGTRQWLTVAAGAMELVVTET